MGEKWCENAPTLPEEKGVCTAGENRDLGYGSQQNIRWRTHGCVERKLICPVDQGHGTGFCMGNILKYAQRYGKKEGRNKNDLMKVIHYAIIQLSQDHYQDNQPELKSPLIEKYNNS